MKGMSMVAAVATAVGLVVGSGSTWGVMAMTQFEEPRHTDESAALPVVDEPPPSPPMDELDGVIARAAQDLKNTPGVHGVGRGYGSPGQDAIVVFVDHASVGDSLPKEIEGYTVVIQVVQGGFSIDW